jgi:hypothetical protein
MWTNHPYIAAALIKDRQERMRQLSQDSHLRRQARQIRRENRKT